ncbi:MAG: aminotransferase class I/II-fold pyridoxal phosphate-dependent enzyme [Bacillota bacterium]
MEISAVASSFRESVIREMTRICNTAGGINLSQGFPDFPAPSGIKEAAVRAIMEDINQYSVTFGSPTLREAVARKVAEYNGFSADPQTEITVTCGATEAMISALKAIINPGDEVIIFEPFYENYGPDCILCGAEPRFITLHPPDWTFDPDELKDAFNDRTKAIVINTPNNPTGKVFSRRELAEIAGLCMKWDCIAVTDEIYEHILYDGNRHVSIASLDGMRDRTITINSVSKTYSLTGWRVGWAIANPEITRAIRTVHDFLTVGAPAPLQEGAAYALASDEQYYLELGERYKAARDFMHEALEETGFKPYLPGGAYYFFVGISDLTARFGLKDDFDFSRWLIEKTGVATVPGTSFYAGDTRGIDQVRFCFCKKRETLEKAVEGLRRLRLGL